MDDYVHFSDIKQECPESRSHDGAWPPINVRGACDILLQRLDDLPPISHSALGQNLGYASIDQKIVYLERRSYLQSVRIERLVPYGAAMAGFAAFRQKLHGVLT
jgi:hypothetical protein